MTGVIQSTKKICGVFDKTFHMCRQYTTEEGHRSVRKLWSFFNIVFYWINVSQLRAKFVFCLQNMQNVETFIRFVITYYDMYIYILTKCSCDTLA